MSDRKYRQRGYQDEPREPRREQKPAEKKEYAPRGQPPVAPKTFNMPGFREVLRCARFGYELMAASAARLHDALGYDLDIKAARASARAAFRILDDHLTHREILGQKWLVGARPTIADVACFPYVALAGDGGIGHEEYPALRNWMRDFRRLPGFHAMSGISEFA